MDDEELQTELRRHFAHVVDRTPPLAPLSQATSTTSHRLPRRAFVALTVALVVATCLIVALALPDSAPSSAQIKQIITTAGRLDDQAKSIHIVNTITVAPTRALAGTQTSSVSEDVDVATGLERATQISGQSYITELLSPRTGTDYVRVNLYAIPDSDATPGWYAFPDATIPDPAPVPANSPGGAGGIAGTATAIGARDIDGVACQGYRYTVSVAALIRESQTELQRSNYRTSYFDRGITEMPGQVWIDPAGHIREFEWQFTPEGESLHTGVQIRTYRGTAAPIKLPPAADVTKEPSARAAWLAAYADEYSNLPSRS